MEATRAPMETTWEPMELIVQDDYSPLDFMDCTDEPLAGVVPENSTNVDAER
jgi:hypothetical protein